MKLVVRGRSTVGWKLAALALFLWVSFPVWAHIGSPSVFFEGQAGPYSVRIVVRPPEVIPGLAEVSVRAARGEVERVTALPMRWNTGRQGAPPPDAAERVRGETNLYSGRLWLMQGGAQSIEVEVSGREGQGKVIVPVDAVATRVLGMPRPLGRVLSGMGLALFVLAACIIGAAVRESILTPDAAPSRARRWWGRGSTLLAALVLGALLWLGNRWWKSEAADYRNNRLYRPLETVVSLSAREGQSVLRLEIVDEKFYRGAPLVPDHGKLMHLFLVREPGLDVFAHLHPEKMDWKSFEAPLPSLPAGPYCVYGDITFETGLSETLTAKLSVPAETRATPAPTGNSALSDPDDSWCQAPSLKALSGVTPVNQHFVLNDNTKCTVDWITPGPLVENRESTLRFSVHNASGTALALDPYLGMAGHLVLRRDDGAVFTHLHPGGSFSMAAQRLFQMRADGRAPLKVAKATNDPICELPLGDELNAEWRKLNHGASDRVISFPYAFPRAGRYRLWLQVKVQGEILTSVFDAQVLPAR